MLKFISLLGTNPYMPCNYYLGEQMVKDCCYIQKPWLRYYLIKYSYRKVSFLLQKRPIIRIGKECL